MNRHQNKKPLDELISKTIAGEILEFDFKKWKQQHQLDLRKFKTKTKDHRTPTPALTDIWRIIMKNRITNLTAAAVVAIIAGIGAMMFFGTGQEGLYAAMSTVFLEADTVHNTVETYHEGEWEPYYEEVFARDRGKAEVNRPTNRYLRTIDDGTYLWRYTPGEGFVVRSKSKGPERYMEHMIYGQWPQGKLRRKPSGDKEIDGIWYQAYYYTYTSGDNTRELWVWIEETEGKKFLRYWESFARDDEGHLAPEKRGTIQYNVPISDHYFVTSFGPEMQIIDADQMARDRFGLENAIFTKEILGLLFAIHEVKRTADDLIYICCSARPTEETQHKFGHVRLSRLELSSISDGILYFPYRKLRLTELWYEGIEAKSWFLVPRKDWPEGTNTLDLGVWLYTNGKLEEELRAKGEPAVKEFMPITTLTLPEERLSIDEIINHVYSQSEEFNPVNETVLHMYDVETKFELQRSANTVGLEEFGENIKVALEQLTDKR